MKELKVKFGRQISIQQFDNQISKLIDNFPKNISVLIKLKTKKDFIEVKLSENPDKKSIKRWEWDLEDVVKLN